MGPNCSPTGALARDYTVSRATKEALSGQYFRRLEAALVLDDFVDPNRFDERVFAGNSLRFFEAFCSDNGIASDAVRPHWQVLAPFARDFARPAVKPAVFDSSAY